jgi:mannobiose 2-epimerase
LPTFKSLKRVLSLVSILLFVIYAAAISRPGMEKEKLIEEMQSSLKSELLDVWYPISVDTVYGGFLCDFTFDWEADGPQNKMLVTQARHVWTASEAAMFYHDEAYRKIAEHGFRFLRDKMWDKEYGGFYMLRNREGGPINRPFADEKRGYGSAFAIYALATYYRMSGDSAALNLTQETFRWLDKHSHDPEYKGYFDRMRRDGSWYNSDSLKNSPLSSASLCWKDQNSSIHLLEAFTVLYTVWPDSLLRQRLEEMLSLIRDVITTERGYMTLFFERDWTPVSLRDSSAAVRQDNWYFDHVSFGHDIETAYLMLEASDVLGREADARTLAIAKKMVDHSLANGWDEENGGFYDAGYYSNDSDSITIINDVKTWWVQAEGLNALLLMAKLFPQEEKYKKAFIKQWSYVKEYLIDHEHGGWYAEGLDKSPGQRQAVKASEWKVNYHNTRALLNCINMLKDNKTFDFSP